MSDSSLSFASTSTFRNNLLGRNLAPYTVQGVFTPPISNVAYETVLTVTNVIDSPDNLISEDVFANQLYPLNEYGPDGGYNTTITFNGPPLPVASNNGEYSPNDTVLDIINEATINAQFIENRFGPTGGFNDLFEVDNIQLNGITNNPYWQPPSFLPSFYTPYEILTNDNPNGSNGLLSQDSFIARIGAQRLQFAFQQRVAAEIFQNTVGQVNLASLQDPFEISLIVTGQQPLIYKNWRITVPENPILRIVDLATRLSSAYWPVSPIPGDYFEMGGVPQNQQTSLALNVANQLTGGFLGPVLNITRNPSETFLANTGNGQRSALFANIDYNRYQPPYDKNYGGILGVISGVADLITNLINPDNGTLIGGYYVGSRNAEPSSITSPPNQVPVNIFGEQVQAPVYGPSELGILYEGNQEALNFGLASKTYDNGGGIGGQFVWVSPKYKDNAGYRPTVGGGVGTIDENYNEVSSDYTRNESTNITFKGNSILDNTQRLIDSADNVQGISRLKHVGNAINQVSKVFNDGYKEMTKGSKVVSYIDNTTGQEAGTEYCRVFAKDTPYLMYNDLQKTDGITTSGRRSTFSVLDNTFNLNIAPTKNPGSTNIIQGGDGSGGHVKKYMLSIENLAWKTSSRPGFTYDDLPVCERGPNGGRIMWFPPYNLKFSDSSSAQWNSTSFLGRPEPIYTYKETSRTGTLSFMIIVDNPSVTNLIVEQQLNGKDKGRIDSVLNSFFAGCAKFDIYELAKKFNTLKPSDLMTYQEIINNPRLTEEELGKIIKEIPKDNTTTSVGGTGTDIGNPDVVVASGGNNTPDLIGPFENQFLDFAFYFDNDIPGPSNKETADVDYLSTYNTYTNSNNITTYVNNAHNIFVTGDTNYNVKEFFDNVVINNFKKITEGENSFVQQAYRLLNDKIVKSISIVMEGSASATATPEYNKKLSLRRIDSIKKYLSTQINGVSLGNFISGGTFIIKSETGFGEEIVIPTYSIEEGADGTTATTVNSGTGLDVDCKKDIVNKSGNVTSSSQVYAANAMACRRVKIKTITVQPNDIEQTNPDTVINTVVDTLPLNNTIETVKVPLRPPIPAPTKTIQQKLKDSIGKRVLRNLLTECNYFEVIKENVPFLYDSFKERIKYFNPAFHSMTPEGLNSRLTFLNQCTRPGETIPVIGTDGKPRINDAVNTSFGAPPILVLRIGDFYNCKIIPDGVSFTYDSSLLDLNPEGIGVQPMLVNVSMNFKMIGGHGIANPVEQLQNALSFNYYANTEIYDERSVWTEDTTAIDKQIADALGLEPEVNTPVNNVEPQPTNDGGSTIGEIITNKPVEGGSEGEISYLKIMDSLLTDSKTYFTTVVNKLEEINTKYNYGIVQLVNQDRNFKIGPLSTSQENECAIYGSPFNIEKKLDSLFNQIYEDINNGTNPIMYEFIDLDFNPSTDTVVASNMTNYIVTEIQDKVAGDISLVLTDILNIEQSFVQNIRKANLIVEKHDGKKGLNNLPLIYTLTSTDNVSPTTVSNATNTSDELEDDLINFGVTMDNFNDYLIENEIITESYDGPGEIRLIKIEDTDISNNCFFMILGRILSQDSKKDEFINACLKGVSDINEPYSLENKFKKIVNDLAKDYSREIEKEEEFFQDFKKQNKYKDYVDGVEELMYKSGKTRKFTFSTVTPSDPAVKTQFTELYDGENHGEVDTYLGKVKLTS